MVTVFINFVEENQIIKALRLVDLDFSMPLLEIKAIIAVHTGLNERYLSLFYGGVRLDNDHITLEEGQVYTPWTEFLNAIAGKKACWCAGLIDKLGGVEIFITQHDFVLNHYFVKLHSRRATNSDKRINMRELFTYEMIEFLGIRPAVLFIPNNHFNIYGVYIATEEVPGFIRGSHWEGAQTNWKTKLITYSYLLCWDDLVSNDGDYGGDIIRDLGVVDVEMSNDWQNTNKFGAEWIGSAEQRMGSSRDFIDDRQQSF